MRTGHQRKGAAGTSEFIVGAWRVEVTWAYIAGRVECSRLVMDSSGAAPVTSSAVREVEAAVRRHRAKRAAEIRKAAKAAGGDVGRKAARQIAGYTQARVVAGGPGPRRDDETWRKRAVVIREAWLAHKPMAEALEQKWPAYSRDTYRKWIDRARAWDQETGAGLLDGVGRPRERGRKS